MTIYKVLYLEETTTLHSTREIILECFPDRLASHLQVFECRASEVQQGHRENVCDKFQRTSQSRIQTTKCVGTGKLEDLEYETKQIVTLKKGGQVQHTTCEVCRVNSGEGVNCTRVSTNAILKMR